jgi:putative (di)nucleoside polyphosphate hydrolase
MSDHAGLPYRRNVGAVLFNGAGLVFLGRRAGLIENWQLPQGGIEDGENPADAVLRELKEEIGTRRATVLAEHDEWLRYDLPAHLIGVAWKGRYRGQTQRWFALRFTGDDSDIALDRDAHPEFDAWRWGRLAELPGIAVDFKRPVYEALTVGFARFAA